jgi:antitoxin VapB
MTTAKLFMNGRSQAVRLPKEFRFSGGEVSIRREGEAVILEPVAKRKWPKGFFNSIHIDDPKFERPVQPDTPPIRQV